MNLLLCSIYAGKNGDIENETNGIDMRKRDQ